MVEVVDVSMKSNFEIYKMTVTEVLKSRKSIVIPSLSKSCEDDPSIFECKLDSACRTYVQDITVVVVSQMEICLWEKIQFDCLLRGVNVKDS